ncbi:hypothetical protein QUF75_15190 [Desulfococcaceae bacterium HSG7]|nr:hypothetical protein [Desulfococcaceae bacterium HSG7]
MNRKMSQWLFGCVVFLSFALIAGDFATEGVALWVMAGLIGMGAVLLVARFANSEKRAGPLKSSAWRGVVFVALVMCMMAMGRGALAESIAFPPPQDAILLAPDISPAPLSNLPQPTLTACEIQHLDCLDSFFEGCPNYLEGNPFFEYCFEYGKGRCETSFIICKITDDSQSKNYFFENDVISSGLKTGNIFVTMDGHISVCESPPPDMIAWYPLDETSGTTTQNIIDKWYDGTLENNATSVSGKVGNALSFDNNKMEVVVFHNSIRNIIPADFSVEFWFNNDSSESLGNINFNKWRVDIHDDGNVAVCNNRICTFRQCSLESDWNHFALVYESENEKGILYSNGTQCGDSVSDISTISSYDLGEVLLEIKAGTIDELAIFDRALSLSEVQAIYNTGYYCTTQIRGTVWDFPGQDTGVQGISVEYTDPNGVVFTTTTNEYGDYFSFMMSLLLGHIRLRLKHLTVQTE